MMTYGVFILLMIILLAGCVLVFGGSSCTGVSSGRGGAAGDDSGYVPSGHICTHCGHIQNQRAQFCGQCGEKLDD